MSKLNGKLFLKLGLVGTCCLTIPHSAVFAGCCGEDSRVGDSGGASARNLKATSPARPLPYADAGGTRNAQGPQPRVSSMGRETRTAAPPLPRPYADTTATPKAQASQHNVPILILSYDDTAGEQGNNLLMNTAAGDGTEAQTTTSPLPPPYADADGTGAVDRETTPNPNLNDTLTTERTKEDGKREESGDQTPSMSRSSDSSSDINGSLEESEQGGSSHESNSGHFSTTSTPDPDPITEIKRDKYSVHSFHRVDRHKPGLVDAINFFNALPETIRIPLKKSFTKLTVKEQGKVIATSKKLLNSSYGDKNALQAQKLLIIQRIIKNVKYRSKLLKLYRTVIKQNDGLTDADKVRLATELVQLSPKYYSKLEKKYALFENSPQISAEELVQLTIHTVKTHCEKYSLPYENPYTPTKKRRHDAWDE